MLKCTIAKVNFSKQSLYIMWEFQFNVIVDQCNICCTKQHSKIYLPNFWLIIFIIIIDRFELSGHHISWKLFLANQLSKKHLAKGCAKQLLEAGFELTPLASGDELNRRCYSRLLAGRYFPITLQKVHLSYTQRNLFEILLNRTEIRLYLLFSD